MPGPARRACCALLLVAAAAALGAASPCLAIGPENVAVVVNADSWASCAVANEYVHLRRIPPGNVVYLRLGDLSDFEIVDVETFRSRILAPVLLALQQRGLGPQIDAVAWSADLPYAVNPAKDAEGKNLPKMITPLSSINSLTYLYALVLAKDVRYLSLGCNLYFRRTRQEAGGKVQTAPAAAFRSATAWSADGTATAPAGGMHYLLSTMLAVTSGRGNSVREAVQCLRSASAADGTAPAGTVFFMSNGDIRSRTRQWGFGPAIEGLARLGVKSAVAEGVLPQNKNDVAGLAAGSADFHWTSCKSRILPGAICEHLTSCGGEMHQRAGQTPLTEWIRHGAAGASGTVTEPYAIQAKFPTPLIHVFYAGGSTLAEAFYQSVAGPYQLLIVGDPLCRPWGKPIRLKADCQFGLPQAVPAPTTQPATATQPATVAQPAPAPQPATPAPASGPAPRPTEAPASLPASTPASPRRLQAAGHGRVLATVASGPAAKRVELFLDGVRRQAAAPGQPMPLDTALLNDGYHELRLVAVGDDAVESDGREVFDVTVGNRGRMLELTGPAGQDWPWHKPIPLSARMDRAREVLFVQNHRVLAKIEGPGGTVQIPPPALGVGPVAVQAVAIVEDRPGTPSVIASRPLEMRIVAPPPLPPLKVQAMLVPGLQLTREGARSEAVKDLLDVGAWNKLDLRKGQTFVVEAYVEASEEDVHQVQMYFQGQATIRIDGELLGTTPAERWQFLPVNLSKGTHLLRVECRADRDRPRLDIRFGARGPRTLSDKTARRPAVDAMQPATRPATAPASPATQPAGKMT